MNNSALFKKNELTLFNILIRSRLCFTKKQSVDFISSCVVFKNSVPVKSLHNVANIGDLIQIALVKYYFFFFKYFYVITRKVTTRIRYAL